MSQNRLNDTNNCFGVSLYSPKKPKMKPKLILAFSLIGLLYLSTCGQHTEQKGQNTINTDNPITGKWIRSGQTGPVGFEFKENGVVEADFGNDQVIDVVTQYELSGDTIRFLDEEGQMCRGYGTYKVSKTHYYLSFDLIVDSCSGRIKTTMGYWTRPNFEDLITTLDSKISDSPTPELFLNRARIYMALGESKMAKEDLDQYIMRDTTNARAYINRAGTRFAGDLKGVVLDCNKALSIDPANKNAYFLRGLARYELGEKEQGCEDFTMAIELGFSILRIAEQEKCADYWEIE
jgi:hypothetical protein